MKVIGMMERNKCLFTSKSAEYITPRKLYKEYDDIFHFTLDPCTTADNPLGTPKFYTKEDDGLKQSWESERVFCNPPYHSKNIIEWIKKASSGKAEVVVMLVPARVDTRWFHDYVYKKVEVKFIRGRLRFGVGLSQDNNSAPFPSMIVIFRKHVTNQ